MEHALSPGEYKDVVLFLATAGVVVPLFQRLKLSPVLGFLVAGAVLGPYGLGRLVPVAPWLQYFTVARPEEVAQLAEFGVVFLLFSIGLELSWERLRLMRKLVFGLGAAQVAVCAGAIGLAAWAMGLPPVTAAATGAALALSSTAVVVPVLSERKRLHSEAGRASFSILLFQDLAVAPILVTLGFLGRSQGDFAPRMLLALAPAAVGLAALVAFGRLLLRPMMKSVARTKSRQLFLAASLLVVIGAGLASAVAGLSMALGAFIAGLLLAETEFRHEVEVTIEPFQGLLLGLFFVSVGIGLDLGVLVADPVAVLGVALGLVAVKAMLIFVLARAFGVRLGPALETALPLAAAGEFAIVVLQEALRVGAMPAGLGESLLVSATLSMFAIPFLLQVAARLRPRSEQPAVAPLEEAASREVLVVGYGRVGRLVGEMLDRHDLAWVAIDRDPRGVDAARRAGKRIYFGDASLPELLRRCGVETAPAVVVTMDSPEAAESVVATVRGLRPDVVLVARARDARHAHRLYELGVTDAVPETVEASLQLSETVLVEVGVPMGLVIASIHERRDEYRQALNRPEALGAKGRRARSRRDA